MTTSNKRIAIILLTIPVLLLIPLIAMQFSREVVWTGSDFVIMGSLLLIVGLLIEFFLRRVQDRKHRAFAVGVILILFLLVWAELAVGVFGTPFSGS